MLELINTLTALEYLRLTAFVMSGVVDEYEMAEENLRNNPAVVRWFERNLK